MSQNPGGKGSVPRPFSIDYNTYSNNWDTIFSKNQVNRTANMHDKLKEIVQKVGTDVSGKWISVDNAEKFATLIIEEYKKELIESQKSINIAVLD